MHSSTSALKARAPALVATALAAAVLVAGCAGAGRAPAGTDRAAAPAAPVASEGVNARGEVIDSSKVVAGEGRSVKGRGDWQGEITGRPAANSKFSKLEIGMPMRQVTDMLGAPTDQGTYVTGKAWIPFYFGSDRYRYELVYKGQGRLIFAGDGAFSYGSGNLTWIIHNPNEPAYR